MFEEEDKEDDVEEDEEYESFWDEEDNRCHC
jgi:hypothetical protein